MRASRFFGLLLTSAVALQAAAQTVGAPAPAGLPDPATMPLGAQVQEFFTHLLDPAGWPPRWHCGRWTDFHGWVYIIADLLVWAAYAAIPFLLVQFIRKRADVPFDRLFWLFALFIVACGSTHLLDAVMFYLPVYRLSALVKVFTAVASWGTVFALIRVLPRALSLRTPAQLEAVVQERTSELHTANQELRRAYDDLETKVTFRTLDLEREAEQLRAENARLRSATS
ncbi:hypothetical protein GCM10022408_02420 [Hymenobacter fastidiosus]|uniref:Ethylene receptor 1-like N-terminal domain-containing protein n=1 Tax=Hymenobacter fastidiosus TaxID=486264 RepID=A0ABP7RCE2_9BACT